MTALPSSVAVVEWWPRKAERTMAYDDALKDYERFEYTDP